LEAQRSLKREETSEALAAKKAVIELQEFITLRKFLKYELAMWTEVQPGSPSRES
jgi:hypothetical protein